MKNSFTMLYKVRDEDNLKSISKKFNTSINDIIKINVLFFPIIFKGQSLKIPVNSNMKNNSYIEYNSLCTRAIGDIDFYVYLPNGNIEIAFILKDGVP